MSIFKELFVYIYKSCLNLLTFLRFKCIIYKSLEDITNQELLKL